MRPPTPNDLRRAAWFARVYGETGRPVVTLAKRRADRRFNIGSRIDPGGANAVIRPFASEMRARFREVKRLIRIGVVDRDVLGLGRGVLAAAPPEKFDFPRDPDGKTRAFLEWLRRTLDDEVLEVTRGPGGAIVSDAAWMETYVRRSASRGQEFAADALRRAGYDVPDGGPAFVNAPIRSEKLSLLYTRVFEELRGVTEAMSQGISRELTEGLARGISPIDMGRNMARTVENIGVRRGTLIARTEVMRVHAESTLDTYERAGADGVSATAEFATAADDRVCPECEALEANVFKLDEARGLIPVHPNCRCVWLPLIGSVS